MVSDELACDKYNVCITFHICIIPSISTTQADCPQVIDIITALNSTSSQFRLEDFPASSEILRLTITAPIKISQNSITFTVHPVPAPFSTNELNNSKISEGGNNQKEILFNLGKAISIAPT